MVDDGPWDTPTAWALRDAPDGQPLPPRIAEAIRSSAAVAGCQGRRILPGPDDDADGETGEETTP